MDISLHQIISKTVQLVAILQKLTIIHLRNFLYSKHFPDRLDLLLFV